MIIGISGKANSGKDEVGRMIQYWSSKLTQEYHYLDCIHWIASESNWKIKKYSEKLKQMVCLMTGCTRRDLENEEFKSTILGEEWDKWGIIRKDCRRIIDIYGSEKEAIEAKNKRWKEGTIEKMELTPRKLLQLLGTECGRDIIHPDVWVNALFSDYSVAPKQKWTPTPESTLSTYRGHCTVCGKMWFSPNKYNKFCHEHNLSQPDVYPDWIITDVRFPNEVKAIKDRGGVIIRLTRDNSEGYLPKRGDKVWIKVFSNWTHGTYIAKDPGNKKHLVREDEGGGGNIYESHKILPEGSNPNSEHYSETALDNHKDWDYEIDNNGSLRDLIGKVKSIYKEIKEK